MNPNATITDEMFEAYLKQIRELVEGPFEEMQKEIEVTNKFPDEFYELAKENDLYRFYLPAEYGGWNLDELEIPACAGRVVSWSWWHAYAPSSCGRHELAYP